MYYTLADVECAIIRKRTSCVLNPGKKNTFFLRHAFDDFRPESTGWGFRDKVGYMQMITLIKYLHDNKFKKIFLHYGDRCIPEGRFLRKFLEEYNILLDVSDETSSQSFLESVPENADTALTFSDSRGIHTIRSDLAKVDYNLSVPYLSGFVIASDNFFDIKKPLNYPTVKAYWRSEDCLERNIENDRFREIYDFRIQIQPTLLTFAKITNEKFGCCSILGTKDTRILKESLGENCNSQDYLNYKSMNDGINYKNVDDALNKKLVKQIIEQSEYSVPFYYKLSKMVNRFYE